MLRSGARGRAWEDCSGAARARRHYNRRSVNEDIRVEGYHIPQST